MNEYEIEGRNLVLFGTFSTGWDDEWEHFNSLGTTQPLNDGALTFLRLNGFAAIRQTFDTADFTAEQLKSALYRLSFKYDNNGDGLNSRLVIIPSTGKEQPIDLSGKKSVADSTGLVLEEEPLADWKPYLNEPVEVLLADKNITLQVHGSDKVGVAGLFVTSINAQLHLAPLKLIRIQIDERTYTP